ncbi:MAG TPA: TetR/AcrR family transcriptional regulator [Bryobacteraceae bacterium]|jgi:AcrR family transcriptional regulator|nr:TetR/AcrR family transcriptional regulator [Bryobacteraceae bacterium]
MGVQERRLREKRELREEILEAARDLFVREGFENVSMRKIAEKIEYSPTTIYLYFQDKADLLDCLCEETLARLIRRQTELDQTIADPVERLRAGLRAYIEFGRKHSNSYQVSFMMPQPFDDPERCPRAHAAGEKAFDHLRGVLRECQRQGRIQVSDLEASARALWATIHGITSLLIAKPRFPWIDPDRVIDTVIAQALDGIHADQSSR